MVKSSFVVPLATLDRGDLGHAGGKGANLGELIRAGFPVPPGFVVTTDAFDAREAAAEEVARAVRRAYRELGGGMVAVRSSATAEDLPEAAFAGQMETYLDVEGEDALLEAVRDCWSSLETERAVMYRAHYGVTDAKMAVVVQRMVPAEYAGVMFTADPVTGARDDVVVDSSAGLGESVVSGRVTPDHYVIRRGRLVTTEKGRREVVLGDHAGAGSLGLKAIKRLARLGKKIEKRFGRPQDIEWAWSEGRPHIVQARPITALPAPPPNSLQRLSATIFSEIIPMRPYPIDITTWTGALLGAVIKFIGAVGVHPPPLERIFIEEDGVVVRMEPIKRIRVSPRLLLAPPTMLRRAVRYRPRDWESDPLFVEIQERVRRLNRLDLESVSDAELRAAMDKALAVPREIFQLRLNYLARAMVAMAYARVALRLRGRRASDLADLWATGDLVTNRANRELEELAAQVRGTSELLALFEERPAEEILEAIRDHPFMDDLTGFLERYGNRETVSPGIASQPTWSAAPEVVLGMIKGFVAAPPPSPESRGVSSARAARGRLPWFPFRRWATEGVTEFARVRDDSRFYATLPLPVVRRIMLEYGRRLVKEGILDEVEDVFHVRWGERPSRETVARRKALRASLEGTPVLDPRYLEVTSPADVENALLTGTPGSPGTVTGPVRVIRDASEFDRLRTGDVLVAPYTNPAWTPLFQRASAVVVDTGGAVSHAAIVAREYGIPAVMGTRFGTTELEDGQEVTVDGSAGAVLPPSLSSPHPHPQR